LVATVFSQMPLLQAAATQKNNLTVIKSANGFLKKANEQLHTSAVFLLNPSGFTVASSNYEEEKSFIGKNYAFRPYFQHAVENDTGRFLAFGVTSNKLGYYISRALYLDEIFQGVIVIKIDLNPIKNIIKGLDGEFLLVDEKNIVFLSSNQKFLFKSLGTLKAYDRLLITKTRQYPLKRIKPLDLKHSSSPYDGQKSVTLRIDKTSKAYLLEKKKIDQLNWSIWLLGDATTIWNQSLKNGISLSALAFISLITFYLLYKRRQDTKRFQTIVDNLPSGITLFDDNLQMLICNENVKRVLDMPEHLFEKSLPSLEKLISFNAHRGEYGPGDADQLAKKALNKTKERKNHRFERTRPNGTILEIRGIWLEQGGFITTYTDITERKNAEKKAELNASYLQALLQNLDQGVIVKDKDLNVVYWNKAFFQLLNLPEDLIKPIIKYEDLVRYKAESGEYGPEDPEHYIHSHIKEAMEFKPYHYERQSPDGNTLEVTGKPLHLDGQNLGFITTFVDISEHKRMSQSLRKLANTDDLTGLNSRRYFTQLLNTEIRRSQRSGHPLSLLHMDLDHFKRVNDTHGHAVGDDTLKAFATATRKVLRDIDIIGRMGGEEFAVMLPNTDHAGALILAERIRHEIEMIELSFDDKKIHLTASIGLAMFDTLNEDDLDNFMKRADKALYRAKHQGRNRVC